MATNNGSAQKAQTAAEVTAQENIDVSYVAAVFDDVQTAKQAYEILKDLRREGVLDIIAAAYMEKTDRSRIKVHEYKDWRVEEGALGGGVVGAAAGAIIGIVGGAILLPVAIGALIGGAIGEVYDIQLKTQEWGKVADNLAPGTSALVAVVADENVTVTERELGKVGGKLIHSVEVPKSFTSAMSRPA